MRGDDGELVRGDDREGGEGRREGEKIVGKWIV